MGWHRNVVPRHLSVLAVLAALVPPAVLGLIAVAASVTAARLGAPFLGAGRWAWLGDAAFALDALGVLGFLGLPPVLRLGRVKRSDLRGLDAMTGGEFEARLAALFDDLGYVVTRTGASGDFGADLVLDRGDERVVVQAKRYDGTVGIEAVQQVVGATRYYDAGNAVVVTSSTCTPAAAELATAHDVRLVERAELIGLLAAHPIDGEGTSALPLLAREIAAGVTLVLFALGCLLRLAWLLLRVGLRLPFVVLRSRR